MLDVGTGSGILAIWSAQAGARKVYAVEATKMAEHARDLVKANNVQDVVEVIEGSMEEVTLPEKGFFFFSLKIVPFAQFFITTYASHNSLTLFSLLGTDLCIAN